ncbi:hypothetical protein [Streptomyces sp. NBC_00401]|nr:hypothetical protein [Streptomyces sp. NBC_00401]MCX5085779.1 hypothetical protein [Streptomyces sp. NBC_00401]
MRAIQVRADEPGAAQHGPREQSHGQVEAGKVGVGQVEFRRVEQ